MPRSKFFLPEDHAALNGPDVPLIGCCVCTAVMEPGRKRDHVLGGENVLRCKFCHTRQRHPLAIQRYRQAHGFEDEGYESPRVPPNYPAYKRYYRVRAPKGRNQRQEEEVA